MNKIVSAIEVAHSTLPADPTDEHDVDQTLANARLLVIDVLERTGKFSNERSAVFEIANRLDAGQPEVFEVAAGWSGSHIWRIDAINGRTAVKFVPISQALDFIREIATLRQLELEGSEQMGVPLIIAAGIVEVLGKPCLWMAQTWREGNGLGSLVRHLMGRGRPSSEREAALGDCVQAYSAVAKALADWHQPDGNMLRRCDRFALRIGQDLLLADEQLSAADGLFGFNRARFLDSFQECFNGLDCLRLPLGRMHIDPHYGNIRVHRDGSTFAISMVDLGNSFYATTRGGACGLPGFDCHMLAEVYPSLRSVRGPILGEGHLTPHERNRLRRAFWESYVENGGRKNTPEQSRLFDAIQSIWYLTWFPVASFFRDPAPTSQRRFRKQVAIAFYINRMKEFYEGEPPRRQPD